MYKGVQGFEDKKKETEKRGEKEGKEERKREERGKKKKKEISFCSKCVFVLSGSEL